MTAHEKPRWLIDLEQWISRHLAADYYSGQFNLPVEHVAVQTCVDGNWVLFLNQAVMAIKATMRNPRVELVDGHRFDAMHTAAAIASGVIFSVLDSKRTAAALDYNVIEESRVKLQDAFLRSDEIRTIWWEDGDNGSLYVNAAEYRQLVLRGTIALLSDLAESAGGGTNTVSAERILHVKKSLTEMASG